MRNRNPLLLLLIWVVSGCGDDDDATDVGRSGANPGLPARGSDAGTTDGAISCTPKAADTPCDRCFKAKCCTEIMACGTECVALVDCIGACEAEACADACYNGHPAGAEQFELMAICTLENCELECAEETQPASN